MIIQQGIGSNSTFSEPILLSVYLVIERKLVLEAKPNKNLMKISLGMADTKEKFSKSCCGCIGAKICGGLDSSLACSSFLTYTVAS